MLRDVTSYIDRHRVVVISTVNSVVLISTIVFAAFSAHSGSLPSALAEGDGEASIERAKSSLQGVETQGLSRTDRSTTNGASRVETPASLPPPPPPPRTRTQKTATPRVRQARPQSATAPNTVQRRARTVQRTPLDRRSGR